MTKTGIREQNNELKNNYTFEMLAYFESLNYRSILCHGNRLRPIKMQIE